MNATLGNDICQPGILLPDSGMPDTEIRECRNDIPLLVGGYCKEEARLEVQHKPEKHFPDGEQHNSSTESCYSIDVLSDTGGVCLCSALLSSPLLSSEDGLLLGQSAEQTDTEPEGAEVAANVAIVFVVFAEV